jgi:hypothetical protein
MGHVSACIDPLKHDPESTTIDVVGDDEQGYG